MTLMNKSWFSVMDENYPHWCHKCGKKIYWKELVHFEGIPNAWMNSYCYVYIFFYWIEQFHRLKRLWRMKDIVFLCCNCFSENEYFGV